MRRWIIVALAALALPCAALLAPPAQADGRVGVFLGFNTGYWGPGYYAPRPYYYAPPPPPVYYPPPAYYAPPTYYPPPAYYPPVGPPAQACYAGPYMCQLDRAVPAGDSCSCPVTGNTRVYGRAG